jgi:sugar lactone lactonase YvrE
MKSSQRSNWYRFHLAALSLLVAGSTTLLAQKPAVTTGGVSVFEQLTSTDLSPDGVAVDTHGNVIVALQQSPGQVGIFAPGSSTPTILDTNLGGIKNVRLDNLGNLYIISPYAPALLEVPYQNGAYNLANAIDLLAAMHSATNPPDGGYMQPADVATDTNGNVYISELYCSASDACGGGNAAFSIFEIHNDGTNPVVFYGPLSDYQAAAAMVLDQYGNLSFADGSGIFGFNVNTVTTGFSNGNCTVCDEELTTDTSTGLGVDSAGNVYVSDGQTSQQVMRVIPNENGTPNGADEYILAGNFYSDGSAGVVPTTGAAYTGDGGYGNADTVRESWLGSNYFGSATLGSGVFGNGMTFNFNNSGTFTNIATVSEGTPTAAGMGEFSYGSGYTMCTAGTTYGSTPGNHTCTLYLNFSPAGVGPRSGSVYLTDANGNILANHFMGGIGQGGEFSTIGGTTNTVISSTTSIGTAKLSSPAGVAVDGVGDVFVADTLNARIVELVAGASSPVVFSTGTATLADPKGVAVDGAGDVYIADGTGNQVVEIDLTGKAKTLISSSTSVQGTKLSNPNAIAVDVLGNVFVSDSGNNRVIRIGQYNSVSVLIPSSTTFGGTALKSPAGIAIDGSDDLFIADSGNNRVVEFSQYGATSVAASNGKTYSSPTGVAVDAAGDLYVTDASGVTAVYLNGHELSAIPSGLSSASGIAIDTNGNLFVANTGDSNVLELNTSNPSVNLGSEAVGSTTAATSVLVYNAGNEPLSFSAAPTLDTGDTQFAISSDTCTNGSSVAPGGVCILGVTFTPSASGAATGSITLSATANGASASPQSLTQTITLNGTGTAASQATTTTTVTGTPNPATIGQTVTLKATVTSGSGTPSGTVTFYYGTLELGSATLSSGTGSITASSAGLPAGSYTITADYAGNSSYKASSGTTSVTLSSKTNTTTTVAATPNPATPGQTVTLKATISSSSCTGSVSFYSGSTFIATADVSGGSASYGASTTGLPAGTYPVTANYSGSTSCAASSGSTSVTLSNAAATTTTVTATPNPATPGQTITLKATVTSGSGTPNGGTVSFYSGTTFIGSATVSNGTASYAASSTGLPVGTYPVTANYGGNTSYKASSGSTNVTLN